jgi:hypothetical protein
MDWLAGFGWIHELDWGWAGLGWVCLEVLDDTPSKIRIWTWAHISYWRSEVSGRRAVDFAYIFFHVLLARCGGGGAAAGGGSCPPMAHDLFRVRQADSASIVFKSGWIGSERQGVSERALEGEICMYVVRRGREAPT